MWTREINGLLRSEERNGCHLNTQESVVSTLLVVSTLFRSSKIIPSYIIGKHSNDPRHIDYAPSVFVYTKTSEAAEASQSRYMRTVSRAKRKQEKLTTRTRVKKRSRSK